MHLPIRNVQVFVIVVGGGGDGGGGGECFLGQCHLP